MGKGAVPPIPDELRDELGGSEALFVVREGSVFPASGKGGAFLLAFALIAAGATMFVVSNLEGVTVDTPVFVAESGTPEGSRQIQIAGGVAGLAGVALIIATIVLARRPGAYVIGTRTSLVRRGLFGTEAVRWSVIEKISVESDGSIRLIPYDRQEENRSSLLVISQPPDSAAVAATIRSLIGRREAARTQPGLPTIFRTTLRVTSRTAPDERRLGFRLMLAGVLGATLFTLLVLSADGIQVTSGDGPPRELTPASPVAWIPAGIGLLVALLGVALRLRARPRPEPMEYAITPDALIERKPGATGGEPFPWHDFRREFRRRSTRHGVEFHIPIRRPERAQQRSEEVLVIVGLDEPDAFDAVLRNALA